ncbi:MAG: LptA/OstA family protein, partial [Alphaproteobacteria bacterium]|nr:LptA/OstA family protein [Alphaproteobacteria bacterium]
MVLARAALAAVLIVSLWLAPVPAAAQQPLQNDEAILFQADDLSYDQASDTIIAQGHVEAAYGERLLFANSVRYNQTTGVVTA